MFDSIRYLLLQVRNSDDPMRQHEINSFARVLKTTPERIGLLDLLNEDLSDSMFESTDMFLLGGSGHYSATGEGPWMDRSLDILRRLRHAEKPVFASCWGFQAMARALGGQVVKDLSRAEVGTHHLFLTEAGKADPLFGPLGEGFGGQMGHEDCVIELPDGATLLASSKRHDMQAYRFEGVPIYCTQFHPELNRDDLLLRVQTYPEYIERIAGLPAERFDELLHETPETEALLSRFVEMVFG